MNRGSIISIRRLAAIAIALIATMQIVVAQPRSPAADSALFLRLADSLERQLHIYHSIRSSFIRGERVTLDSMVRKFFEHRYFKRKGLDSFALVWRTRDSIRVGGAIDNLPRTTAIARVLIRGVRQGFHGYTVVQQAGIPIYHHDSSGRKRIKGYNGLVLKTIFADRPSQIHVVPVHDSIVYREGEQIYFTYDFTSVVYNAGYIDPVTGDYKYAWGSAAVFVGRHVDRADELRREDLTPWLDQSDTIVESKEFLFAHTRSLEEHFEPLLVAYGFYPSDHVFAANDMLETMLETRIIDANQRDTLGILFALRDSLVVGAAVDTATLLRVRDLAYRGGGFPRLHVGGLVVRADVPLYSDSACTRLRKDYVGLMLRTTGVPPGHVTVFPTTRRGYFVPGVFVGSRWSDTAIVQESWYIDPETRRPRTAFHGSYAFTAGMIDEPPPPFHGGHYRDRDPGLRIDTTWIRRRNEN